MGIVRSLFPRPMFSAHLLGKSTAVKMILRTPARAPYGTWESPINAAHIANTDFRIEDVIVDAKTSKIYVLQKRPLEGGRSVVVSLEDNVELFGRNWDARTAVHECGGPSAIIYDGVLYFSNIIDGRVYQVEVGNLKDPIPITPENHNHRFGDFTINCANTRWLVCILEDHTNDAPATVKNTLVAIDTRNHHTTTLARGHDFYTNPRFSPDGKTLAWRQWDHPHMPWEGSQIFVASCVISEGEDNSTLDLRRAIPVAGQSAYVGVAQPQWTASNELLFLSDVDRYTNPWVASYTSETELNVESVLPAPIREDFGELDWSLGLSSYALFDDDNVVYSSFRNGRAQIYLVDLANRTFRELETPYALIRFIRHVSKGKVTFLGKMSNSEDAVIELTLDIPEGKPKYRVIKGQDQPNEPSLPPSFISLPQPLQIRVLIEGFRLPVHVVYYPPTNPEYLGGIPGELPPSIMDIHGGPNLLVDQSLDWKKQYFTSRGWAWIDLNYSGSAGYGRDYRERLTGSWGVFDVNEAVEVLYQLGKRSLIDPKRACIRGTSAGGFTALATLSTKPGTFAAGVSFCGASDLVKLQSGMPKLMCHMLEGLIGGSLGEIPHLWKARSPLNNTANIKVPLLILQGAIDSIVPMAQSEDIVKSIEEHGGQVKFVVFEGEGHMWRRADTVARALEEELGFYKQVFGFGTKE